MYDTYEVGGGSQMAKIVTKRNTDQRIQRKHTDRNKQERLYTSNDNKEKGRARRRLLCSYVCSKIYYI